MKRSPALYICDFGYGILRYDIAHLCFHDHIDNKTGEWIGLGIACEFDFRLLEWTRKLKTFLGWDKQVIS